MQLQAQMVDMLSVLCLIYLLIKLTVLVALFPFSLMTEMATTISWESAIII